MAKYLTVSLSSLPSHTVQYNIVAIMETADNSAGLIDHQALENVNFIAL